MDCVDKEGMANWHEYGEFTGAQERLASGAFKQESSRAISSLQAELHALQVRLGMSALPPLPSCERERCRFQRCPVILREVCAGAGRIQLAVARRGDGGAKAEGFVRCAGRWPLALGPTRFHIRQRH